MAPYQSNFDPPPRSEYGLGATRLGTYTHISSSGRIGHMEAETADSRQGISKTYGRQTALPRPSGRGTSSATDTALRGKSISNFGFRRPVEPRSGIVNPQVLQPKNSRNVLRRKPSTIAQHAAPQQPPLEENKSESPAPSWSAAFSKHHQNASASFGFEQSVDEDTRQPTIPNVETPAPVIPELDRYRSFGEHAFHSSHELNTEIPHKLATQDLPPPTPLNSGMSGHSRYSGYSGNSAYSGYSGYSASPSTRFSESPGPGAYSRDTTPTSMSSQSPSIVAPLRMTPRLRQNSPISSRPPVTRRRAGSTTNEPENTSIDVHGLPSLRESLTSSSSNSTVKEGDKSTKSTKEKKKKRLSPMPPSPPPRKSSQKFHKSRSDGEEGSPSKPSRTPAQPVMTTTATEMSSVALSPSKPAQLITINKPPIRPSREGTPNLESQLEESRTVIHSNLTGLPFSTDRRQSIGFSPKGQTGNNQIDASPRPSLSKIPSRDYPPSPEQRQRSGSIPAPSGLGIIPDLRPVPNQTHQQRQIPSSRTPSPSTSAPKHRFGIFSRRNKAEPEATIAVQKETMTRKGPAAGTGHEGYGRYAFRGRSGSNPSTRNRSHSAASSSQESISSTHTHDPFLLERMSPVVITGGGEVRSESLELARSESSHSLATTRPSTDSRPSFSQNNRSNLSNEVTRTTLWPSALPRFPNGSSSSLASKAAHTSESSDNERPSQKPSLALRRSMHRLQSADQEPLRLPTPIKISAGGTSPVSSNQATSLRSDEQEASQTAGGKKGQVTGPKKLSKRPQSPRKWNFFKRSQTSVNPKPQANAIMPVVVARAPAKTVPYYAMMDSSEQEDETPMDMEEILRAAEVFDVSHLKADSPVPGSQASNPQDSKPDQQDYTHRNPLMVLPVSSPATNLIPVISPPGPSTALAMVSAPAEEDVRPRTPGRPSRLAQVGRIPRVVTARPQQTSPKSFSRPFARVSMIQPPPSLSVVDKESIAVGPSPRRSPSPKSHAEPILEVASEEAKSDEVKQLDSVEPQKPFLVMPARKGSAATTSSSSGALSFAGTTAIVPEPGAALEEDEVWGEYDDLIGNEDVKVPESATSSHGVPFQYESFISRAKGGPGTDSSNATVVPIILENSSSGGLRRLELTSPIINSPKSSFNGLPSPGTPMSFTDFISGYGDRNNSVILGSGGSRRHSSPHSQRNSRPTSGHSRSGSLGERPRQSTDSKLRTIAEQTHESPISQVNLRVGSMTVSKWLSFGHVLFSPVRDEILQADDPARHYSVLVVDGLGNDDWAFYAAETYPSATFYNLSPTPSGDGSAPRRAAFPQAPINHRQVQYSNTLEKFPFPRDTFMAVVLRFPPASSDAAVRNLIAESKRVLKPAGYLEMSILDLDMMNMGNRARRAVRGLKVKISVADPSKSLASAADTVLRMVGRRGFHDIKSCNVGVPVASTVGSKVNGQSDAEEKDISLADMMKDDSSVGDAGITKMVARVGRWWYLRCYEMAVLPDGDTSRSIFADAALLRECEKWNTSFKLLVCYAQKPIVPRRRTASV